MENKPIWPKHVAVMKTNYTVNALVQKYIKDGGADPDDEWFEESFNEWLFENRYLVEEVR